MPTPGKKNELPAKALSKPTTPTTLNIEQIVEAVVDQRIALKNIKIYPEKHDQVQKSLSRANLSLQKALSTPASITLGVIKDALLIGEEPLAPEHAVIKEFAAILKHHNIASVTYSKDLKKEELLRFLSLLSQGTDSTAKKEGVASRFPQDIFPNILVRTIDYSQFHFTEEDEISRSPNEKENQGDNIWYDFITHYTAGTLTNEMNGIAIEEIQHLSPSQLAQALNSNRMKTTTVLPAYDCTVDNHLQALSSGNIGIQNKQGQMDGLNCLLLELKPELRRQFLSVTFKRCESTGQTPGVESFLTNFSESIVLDMLRQANAQNQEISPSLLTLIQKIAGIKGITQESASTTLNPTSSVPKPEELENLFQREAYESFVVPEYDALLHQVADTSDQPSEISELDFDLDEHLETLSSPQLDIKLTRIILVFLNRSTSIDEYKDYTDQLLGGINVLLEAGEFSLLYKIAAVFISHKKNKSTAELKEAAAHALKKLRNESVIAAAVEVFDEQAPSMDSKAYRFLIALGPSIVSHVLTRMIRKDVTDESSHLFNLLSHFRKKTVAQTIKRLAEPKVLNITKMLNLLQRINATEAVGSVQPYLGNADPIIQLEALKAALHFSDPEAIPFLRQSVDSQYKNISSRAIQLTGQYRIKELVPVLISKIKKFVFFKPDYRQNGLILSALGKIGDPAAIPIIETLLSRSFSFYPKQHAHIKKLLYASLGGYPYKFAIPLLRSGYKSKDKTIQTICRRTRKKLEGSRAING